jgi:hypothetical protein
LLMTNYHNLLRNDYDWRNFQVLNPKCFVIIGKYNDLTKQQTKCFELFRNTNKDIEILTFDEVYEKMCSLLTIFNIGDE